MDNLGSTTYLLQSEGWRLPPERCSFFLAIAGEVLWHGFCHPSWKPRIMKRMYHKPKTESKKNNLTACIYLRCVHVREGKHGYANWSVFQWKYMMVQHDWDFFNFCIFSIESFYKAFNIIKRNNLMILSWKKSSKLCKLSFASWICITFWNSPNSFHVWLRG